MQPRATCFVRLLGRGEAQGQLAPIRRVLLYVIYISWKRMLRVIESRELEGPEEYKVDSTVWISIYWSSVD
jgi:hypothetical protein